MNQTAKQNKTETGQDKTNKIIKNKTNRRIE